MIDDFEEPSELGLDRVVVAALEGLCAKNH